MSTRRTKPPVSKTNKICGAIGCPLTFHHWHDKEGGIHVATITHHTSHTSRPAPEAVATDDAGEIERAIKALPCSDDPEADRFKGKSREEAQIIVVREHLAKLSEQLNNQPNLNLIVAAADALRNVASHTIEKQNQVIEGIKELDARMDIIGEKQVDYAEALRCKLDHLVENRLTVIDSNIAQLDKALAEQVEAHVTESQFIGKTAADTEEILRMVRDWRLADRERYVKDEENFKKKWDALSSILQTINYNVGHSKPGFWTLAFASAVGGAGLIALILAIIAAVFYYNSYIGG